MENDCALTWMDALDVILRCFGCRRKRNAKNLAPEPATPVVERLHSHEQENPMIAYDPKSPHVLWFNIWRTNIQRAKGVQGDNSYYCKGAVIAQAQYVEYLALEIARHKS